MPGNLREIAKSSVLGVGAATVTAYSAAKIADLFGLNLDPHVVGEILYKRDIPFIAGATVGIGQNLLLLAKTLKKLEGKTSPGDIFEVMHNEDGSITAEVACIDGRIQTKTGAVMAGFGLVGSEVTGVAVASAIANKVGDEDPVGQFATGYFLGSNFISNGLSFLLLCNEVGKIADQYPDEKVNVNIRFHNEGCGAQATTNPVIYWAKFVKHWPLLADVLSAPNVATGYAVTNTAINVLTGLRYGGRVSVRACLGPSEIVEIGGEPQHS